MTATYPPLDALKPVAPDVWIVDGPTIGFGPRAFALQHPTRMTVIRLKDGSLFLHSPTEHTPELRRAIEALGVVRWIVGPNRVHYWWIPDWRAACPDARVWLAPRIREQAGERIAFPAEELAATTAYPWSGEIDALAIPRSGFMTEYEFFHRATRTLVLTDVAGATGETPRDLRLFSSRATLRRAVETMIAWGPERIVLAHGRWYPSGAVAELRRVFRWLL